MALHTLRWLVRLAMALAEENLLAILAAAEDFLNRGRQMVEILEPCDKPTAEQPSIAAPMILPMPLLTVVQAEEKEAMATVTDKQVVPKMIDASREFLLSRSSLIPIAARKDYKVDNNDLCLESFYFAVDLAAKVIVVTDNQDDIPMSLRRASKEISLSALYWRLLDAVNKDGYHVFTFGKLKLRLFTKVLKSVSVHLDGARNLLAILDDPVIDNSILPLFEDDEQGALALIEELISEYSREVIGGEVKLAELE